MAAVTTRLSRGEHQIFSPERAEHSFPSSFDDYAALSRNRRSTDKDQAKPDPHQDFSAAQPDGRSSSAAAKELIDIRRDRSSPIDLRTQTVEALSATKGAKSLPSLLVWSEKGQEHFYKVLEGNDYYPFHVENEMIKNHARSIASRIVSSGSNVLIELGAGSMAKTGCLLSALDTFQTPVTYYALDVDQVGLARSLKVIRSKLKLKNVALRGLLGTYEDGARWLATASQLSRAHITFIWLGSSMGNCSPSEASSLLGMFNKGTFGSNFIIAMDGCKDPHFVTRAYDSPSGSNRRFIRTAIDCGAEVLGKEGEQLMNNSNWEVDGRWNAEESLYESFLRPTRDLAATIDGRVIEISKDDRLPVICSRKWDKQDIRRIATPAGLEVEVPWRDENFDYGIYWLHSA